jgi:hypothetical protein
MLPFSGGKMLTFAQGAHAYTRAPCVLTEHVAAASDQTHCPAPPVPTETPKLLLHDRDIIAHWSTLDAGWSLSTSPARRKGGDQLALTVFRLSISKQTMSRELRAMGFRKLSACPRHHAKDEDAAAAFKKHFAENLAQVAVREAPGKFIEIWFQDEARVGQKNKITRRWARCGTRPSAPRDQRTSSAYIFGAICPAKAKGAALVLRRCTTTALALHLAENLPLLDHAG